MTIRKDDSVANPAKKRKVSASRPLSRRPSKTVKAAVDDFLLDHQSQNHSPQTLRWHRISLDHFLTFLEKEQNILYLSDLETVHIRAWLVFLEIESR